MNIIVTGASRGIGFNLALQFASLHGNKILAISRSESRLKDLQQQCHDQHPGSDLQILPYDLEDIDGIEGELLDRIRGHVDSVDVLVNNAGLLIRDSIPEIKPSDAGRMMQVNFIAPLILTRTLLSLLQKGNSPHVVNIGSMAGVPGARKFPGISGYSASKAAVHILTECLAEEFGETGVKFNALALGSVQTEMLAEAFPGLEAPLKPAEMAGFIMDFALKAQKFLNGKIIPVALSTP